MRGERGQTLPLALIFVALAGLLLTFLIPHFSTVARSEATLAKREKAYWAAEAGLNMIVADLVHGADALSPDYSPPELSLNGFTARVKITRPKGEAPPSKEHYLDPGVSHPAFKLLRAGNGYLLRIKTLKPGMLEINWAYRPSGESRIGVWSGPLPLSPGKLTSWPERKPAFEHQARGEVNHLGPFTIDSGGTYDIVFFNPLWMEGKGVPQKNTDKLTSPSGRGGYSATWVLAKAYQDYQVTSSAGGATITAYLRQIPGPCEPPTRWEPRRSSWQKNRVLLLSWKSG